jgi:hypothetical protein
MSGHQNEGHHNIQTANKSFDKVAILGKDTQNHISDEIKKGFNLGTHVNI